MSCLSATFLLHLLLLRVHRISFLLSSTLLFSFFSVSLFFSFFSFSSLSSAFLIKMARDTTLTPSSSSLRKSSSLSFTLHRTLLSSHPRRGEEEEPSSYSPPGVSTPGLFIIREVASQQEIAQGVRQVERDKKEEVLESFKSFLRRCFELAIQQARHDRLSRLSPSSLTASSSSLSSSSSATPERKVSSRREEVISLEEEGKEEKEREVSEEEASEEIAFNLFHPTHEHRLSDMYRNLESWLVKKRRRERDLRSLQNVSQSKTHEESLQEVKGHREERREKKREDRKEDDNPEEEESLLGLFSRRSEVGERRTNAREEVDKQDKDQEKDGEEGTEERKYGESDINEGGEEETREGEEDLKIVLREDDLIQRLRQLASLLSFTSSQSHLTYDQISALSDSPPAKEEQKKKKERSSSPGQTLSVRSAVDLLVEQPWYLMRHFRIIYEDRNLLILNKPWDVRVDVPRVKIESAEEKKGEEEGEEERNSQKDEASVALTTSGDPEKERRWGSHLPLPYASERRYATELTVADWYLRLWERRREEKEEEEEEKEARGEEEQGDREEKEEGEEERKVRLCHQLDYATSGLLMLAHNKETAREVQDLLQAHRIYKEYAALVYGHPKWNVVEVETGIAPHPSHPFKMIATDRKGFPLSPLSLSENSSLFFNPSSHCVAHGGESSAGVEKQKKKVEIKMREEYKGAKKAVSRLQVLMRGYFNLRGPLHGEPATLLKLSPITGRRHQLRVHCHYVGHSIVGDSTYGGPHDSFPFRMFLHASTLYFPSVSSSLKSSSSRNSLDLGEKERGKREGEAHKKSVEDAKEETHVKSCEGGELENRRKKFSLRTGGSCTSSCLLKEREVLGPLKAEKIEEDKQNPPSLGEDKQKKKKKRHLQNVSYLSEVPQKVTAPHDFALFLDPELNPPSLSPS